MVKVRSSLFAFLGTVKQIINIFWRRVLLLLLALSIIAVIVIVSWGTVSNVSLQQDTAALVFTAGTVQIGIALTVLWSTWRTFHQLGKDIPEGQPRLKFDLRDVKDTALRERLTLLLMIGMAIFLLAFCIAAELLAIFGVAGIMLRLSTFSASNEGGNFRFGLFATVWGLAFFVSGITVAGMVYGGEAVRFMTGRKNLIFVTLPIGKLRKNIPTPKKRGWPNGRLSS